MEHLQNHPQLHLLLCSSTQLNRQEHSFHHLNQHIHSLESYQQDHHFYKHYRRLHNRLHPILRILRLIHPLQINQQHQELNTHQVRLLYVNNLQMPQLQHPLRLLLLRFAVGQRGSPRRQVFFFGISVIRSVKNILSVTSSLSHGVVL